MGNFESSKLKAPRKEGWMEKKSPSFFAGWQSRQFVIKDHIFRYSKETKGAFEQLGTLNFDLY